MLSSKEGTINSLSLFNRIKQQLDPGLSVIGCTKTTLVNLSHILEDLVLSRGASAIIFVGFQESNYWRQEAARYRALAQVVQQVCVFSIAPLPPECEVASIHIPLRPGDPLCQEWFLAILSEAFAVILCGQDTQGEAAEEDARQFETLWSFEPRLINAGLDALERVVADYRPDKLPQLQAARHNYPPILPDVALMTEFTLQLLRFEEGLNQRYRDHLEDLVIERTAELRAAHQNLQREVAERQWAEAERENLWAAEQKTQQQAWQMQQILDSIEAGLLLLDADYHIKLVNPAGRIYMSMLAGAEIGQILTHLGNKTLEDLLALPQNSYYHEVTPSEATQPIFEVTARPVLGESKTEGWVLVLRDVTAERDTQRRLQQQEKLAAVGQLAAGIAHDFNNILTGVIGLAELALTTPQTPDSVQRDLVQIIKQGRRAAHLVRQILDFARQNISVKRSLEFSRFLDEVLKLLERTIPETIRLELAIEPNSEGYTITADPIQLQQVFTNLAVNAADAMPLGGLLRFQLSKFTLASGQHPPYPGMPAGNWLVVAISDTGIGIPPEAQTHIFEPFFTTKEVGQGAGLGLAQADGIIKQHGGYINMESKVGHGTTFTLFLPALPLSKSTFPEMLQAQKPQTKGQTILLVEDNLAVLTVVGAMLERLGYQVLTAVNGREALELCYQHQAEIALVITDLAMPEMDGLTLARILHTSQLHLKILAITGYPLKMKPSDLATLGIVGWLQKPLELEQLTYKLEQLLSKKS